MIRSDRVWPVAIMLSAAIVGALAVGGTGSPLRPIVTLGFLTVCPGMAIIRLLQLEDVLTELTLAVAFSIALDSLVAGTMLYVGWWSPRWALGLLLGVSVIGAACQLRPARLGSSTEAESTDAGQMREPPDGPLAGWAR